MEYQVCAICGELIQYHWESGVDRSDLRPFISSLANYTHAKDGTDLCEIAGRIWIGRVTVYEMPVVREGTY